VARLATIEGPHGVDQAPASELPAPLAERFAAAPADALDLARHSLRRPQLARRYPGRQFLCDNPVGDELAEAGAPADFIDDRVAVFLPSSTNRSNSLANSGLSPNAKLSSARQSLAERPLLRQSVT